MISLRTLLLLGAALLTGAARAQTDSDADETNTKPDRAELWVPADRLAAVLKNHPRAVLMTRAQYETLLREAAPKEPLPDAPPRDAALVSAHYQGKVEGKVLSMQGELKAQVLSGDWAQLPLKFGTLSLAEIKVDGEGALALPQPAQPAAPRPKGEASIPAEEPPALLLRGRGPHKITLRFASPISTTDAWRGTTLGLPAAGATSLVVDFPPHTLADCAQPLRTEELPDATRVTVALPLNSCDVLLRWRSSGGGLVALPPSLESKTAFTVDAETVQAKSDLTVSTATGTLPETLEFALAADARLVEVTGSDVAGWTVAGQRVTLRLPPGRGSRAQFSTVVQRATGLARAPIDVPLPLPELVGAGRIEGEFSAYGGAGVAVRELSKTPGATPLPPENGVAGRWHFLGPKVTPQIRVERLRPRFSADLDTLVDFQPEAIFIERTVTLHPEEGGVFNLLLTLPAGEEVLTVVSTTAKYEMPAERDPLWHVEAGRLSLRWLDDPLSEQPRVVRVRTRVEPAGWASGVGRTTATVPAAAAEAETFTFPVAEAKIEGAEKVSGYLALRASENFRLETTADDTLEPRDGRTTPVSGAYAWFRRGDISLKVRVTRRPSERLAALTGYALPLAGVLDLRAQIAWDFRYSGVRSVQVRVPEKQADLFYFDGPQIAEKTLAGDTWTLVFQKELTGRQVLNVTAQIPVTRAADDPSRFTTAIPVIEPLHTQRSSGTWVVEANTDTEIQLTATGMNELDAPLAPPLPGYQPRHRVIGVFTWLGPTYGLSLSGVRHAGAEVLKTVVDSLELASVVATTGTVRSEATLQVRTAGAQFLDVTLPQSARLLSLLVDGEPSKPVEGRRGDVRIQLPAKPDPSANTDLVVLYEYVATPEWTSLGASTLEPLRLPHEVPVLKTTWHAYLPNGYFYAGGQNSLAPAPPRYERPLVFAPLQLWKLRGIFGAFRVLGSSGIGDPRALSFPRSREFDAEGSGSLVPEGRAAPGAASPNMAISQNAIDALLFDKDLKPSAAATPSQEQMATGLSQEARNEFKSFRNGASGEKLVASVKQLLVEAHGFFDTGRLDLATKRCEQILTLDPYNIAARKMQAEIDKKREEYAAAGYSSTRNFALWQTQKAWDRPVRPAVGAISGVFTDPQFEVVTRALNGKADARRTAAIQRKLDSIIIPRLDFRDATIREVIEFLKQKSVTSDVTEPNAALRGMGIVLRLDEGARPVASATGSQPLIEPGAIPGLEPLPANSGTNPQASAIPAISPNEARISIALNNVPLGEALRYVANLAGLKVKIESNVVALVPLTAATESLLTKEWSVPPGFLSTPPSVEPPAPGKKLVARDYLTAAGITFPPGSSATFLPSSSKLIVTNTQENLDMIDNLVEPAGGPDVRVAAQPAEGEEARKVGLLPMHLDLPKVGEEMVVSGFGAPEPMVVKYHALESRSRWLWMAFFTGALGYAILGGRHPWWRTAWVVLWLTALPLCIWPALTTLCNLLLGGWLVALVIGRLARRFIFTPRKEALA